MGFKAVRAERRRRDGPRRLIEVDLWEVSVVTFPALAGARVTRVAA
ncbi:MAG: HK97 family phage prohead protease [Phreatobacter sp.]